MDLASFGAVLGFAIDLEEAAARFYDAAAGRTGEVRYEEQAAARRKRRKVVEAARRENVTEMILEPIYGLTGEEYWPADAIEGIEDPQADVRRLAIALEARSEGFYRAAAEKVSILEVQRILRRLARGSAEAREELEAG